MRLKDKVALHPASDEACFVTGVILDIDAGRSV